MANPFAVIPLITAGLFGIIAYVAWKRADDPEGAMARWRRRSGCDYVGPDRRAYLRKIEVRNRILAILAAVAATLQLLHAGFLLTAPSPEELRRRKEANDAAFRLQMSKEADERRANNPLFLTPQQIAERDAGSRSTTKPR